MYDVCEELPCVSEDAVYEFFWLVEIVLAEVDAEVDDAGNGGVGGEVVDGGEREVGLLYTGDGVGFKAGFDFGVPYQYERVPCLSSALGRNGGEAV